MKIAMYYLHYGDLGHSTRMQLLAKHLRKRGHKVLLLQGGPSQKIEEDTVQILPVLVGKEWYKDQKPSRYVNKGIISQRSKQLINTVTKFNPDVLITEYFPLGREVAKHEIGSLLTKLKSEFPHTKIVASIGYPIIATSLNTVKKYLSWYDKVLVHTPKEEVDIVKKVHTLRGTDPKMYEESINFVNPFFTGYIVKDMPPQTQNNGHILVSRGSGVVYPKILTESIKAAQESSEKFVVCMGPETDPSTVKECEEFKPDNVELHKWRSDFVELLTTAKYSISMSGYNTSLQVLRAQKPAIVIPLANTKDIEQMYRVALLKEYIPLEVINYHSISKDKILDALKNLEGKKPIKSPPPEWWDGIKNTIQHIESYM